MGELILKNNIHQDWVSLIFFINLLFISWMFFLDPLRLRGLIKFYATDFYMSKFISEKKLNYLMYSIGFSISDFSKSKKP